MNSSRKLWLIFMLSSIIYVVEMGSRYEIILERVESAFGKDDKILSYDSIRIKKFNRTTQIFPFFNFGTLKIRLFRHILDGSFEIKVDLDDKLQVRARILNYLGNQYKMIAEKNLGNFCEAVYSSLKFKPIFIDYQNHCTVNVPWKSCPYPKGRNEVKEFHLSDLDDYLPPYLSGSEKWQIQMRFMKDGEELHRRL